MGFLLRSSYYLCCFKLLQTSDPPQFLPFQSCWLLVIVLIPPLLAAPTNYLTYWPNTALTLHMPIVYCRYIAFISKDMRS